MWRLKLCNDNFIKTFTNHFLARSERMINICISFLILCRIFHRISLPYFFTCRRQLNFLFISLFFFSHTYFPPHKMNDAAEDERANRWHSCKTWWLFKLELCYVIRHFGQNFPQKKKILNYQISKAVKQRRLLCLFEFVTCHNFFSNKCKHLKLNTFLKSEATHDFKNLNKN